MRSNWAIALMLVLCSARADDLRPPPEPLRELRFSPNGKYVLAQDDSEITVLTVQPLAILSRFPAEGSDAAKFTPDSRQIAFVNAGTHFDSQRILFSKPAPHVERWNVIGQTRAESIGLHMLGCGTEELSPDGRFLVCVGAEGTLRILDVAISKILFEQKKFVRLLQVTGPESGAKALFIGNLGFANITFSTDSRYVVVWADTGSTLAWDLREKTPIELNEYLKGLRKKMMLHFTFLTSDTALITHAMGNRRGVFGAKVVAFPSGELLSKVKVPIARLYRSTYPGFVIAQPFGHSSHRTTATNLSTGQVIISDGGLDVFDHYYVAELVDGKEVGLYEIGKGLQSSVVIH